MKSGIYDINGIEIEEGHEIKYWNFKWTSCNSSDIWGSEPQNSSYIEEAYMEQLKSKVYFHLGAFCIKNINGFLSLKEIIEKSYDMVECYKHNLNEYEYNIFLNESIFDDKIATESDIKNLFKEFEIILTQEEKRDLKINSIIK
jgi:hypothetical protein